MLSLSWMMLGWTLGQGEARAYRVPVVLPDVVTFAEPREVTLDGFLGDRVRKNALVRLKAVDENDLLDGFRKRPGRHPWIGEHVGKFLHAATLAAMQTNDPELRAKVVRVAKGLIATQEDDGYLGTYLAADRWQVKPGADWDVWSHKYDLVGLLCYYRYFHDEDALRASRKIGDLLTRTFGPGKKSLLTAGTHVGMASTSALEPMVELYRLTGEPRYLAFAKDIVRTWEEPKGPDILRGLLGGKSVDRIANGKAYEMLSNIVGLCELARVTGNRTYVEAAQRAWANVKARHLYPTGTCSYFEHFHEEKGLPVDELANVGETCVTVTWMQLNAQLLRLTGEAKYGGEIERSAFNHLAGAQRPDGGAWCYYTSLEGKKPYSPETTCCLSSGPRGMALMPTFAYLKRGPRHFAVNLLESSRFRTRIEGQPVTLTQTLRWDRLGSTTLRLDAPKPTRMTLSVRIPEWADVRTASPNRRNGQWLVFPERVWRPGETVRLAMAVRRRTVPFQTETGIRRAIQWGPFLLAYDEALNAQDQFGETLWEPEASVPVKAEGGTAVRSPNFYVSLRDETPRKVPIRLVPFADAGAPGTFVKAAFPDRLLLTARESRSRPGNTRGSIADGQMRTFVVTFDGKASAEDWYALEWPKPKTIWSVSFRHGRTFHDGGWFDTSQGKPRIEVRRTRGGPWEEVGHITPYPETTRTSSAGLRDGYGYGVSLAEQISAYGLRIVGVPASGDAPHQAFSSCAEIEVGS